MSLSLPFTTTLFERVREHAPTRSAGPPAEKPHEQRERLRRDVHARGGVVTDVETIRGDCPAQTAQQIRDLSAWLERS